MADTTVVKVDSANSPTGPDGQKYLAGSKDLGMRLWQDEPPTDGKPAVTRDYETIGYVVKGKAELTLEGQTVTLNPGDSWVVPKGASHSYRIIERLTAVEVTHPPAHVAGRDR